MNVAEDAFSRLFPGIGFNYDASITYSGKFKPYNATVRKLGSSLHFSLSSSWKGVSDEIVIGLIQCLLVKILRHDKSAAAAAKKRSRITSLNMQLYDEFIKGISEVAAADGNSDEMLEASFGRVNRKYFLGLMDRPNLKWGNGSFRKLACYEYHTNTVSVSNLFSEAPERLLDYLMYHELLHKKLKFSSSNGRSVHHSSEFRRLEQNFDSSASIEGELNDFIRSNNRFGQINRSRRFGWRRIFSFQ